MKKKNPGKAAKHEFYRVLGATLAQWYGVEKELFEIFNCLMGGVRMRNAAAYHTLMSLRAKMDMTDEVAHLILGKEPGMLEKWSKEIYGNFDEHVGARNRLVHFMPIYDSTAATLEEAWRLKPRTDDVTRKAAKSKPYETKDIEECGARFKTFAKEMRSFRLKLP